MRLLSVFASHVACAPGLQGLDYIQSAYATKGIRTIRLTGGDPCPPTEGFLLVQGPDEFRYAHPYVHELRPGRAPETAYDERLNEWLMRHMRWTLRAAAVCFVNPKFLTPGARFEGIHLAGFRARLDGICQALTSTVH